jgi:cytochrome P450
MNSVWIPFTAGPRACIGRNVTILFQLIYLATIFFRYDFAFTSKDWEQDWEDTFSLWPNPLPMKIWRRELHSEA